VTLPPPITIEGGVTLSNKKLISRIFLYTLHDGEATAALRSTPDRKKKITWKWSEEMTINELMLDAGFERDPALSIESVGTKPLTILALISETTVGG
jgi:hypothetical protein